jgi:tripartite-type tricarboxylate transporter receptor subunit TctC
MPGIDRRTLTLAALSLASGGALSSRAAWAQEFPVRPIHIFVGQPAGSGPDVICRYFAEEVGKLSGQPMIVENKGGAGGNLATQAVASARGDGHALLFSTSNSLTGNFFLFRDVGFKLEDFAPIASVAQAGIALAVKGDSPVRSVAELTALLKQKEGKARYGAPTSTALAAAELYLDLTGTTAIRVPYRSAPQALTDLTGGEIDFFFIDAVTGLGPARRGQIRLLGVTARNRLEAAPDLPTMHEAGVTNYELGAWFGIFAPAGTPAPVREKLTKWFVEVAQRPATKEFLLRAGVEPLPGDPAALMQIVAAHTETYRRLAAAGKIKPQD